MNPISNIWNHPKTSAAGLLIGVITIASVFSQQGITLGTAGSGTMVTLVSGLATALLGLLARDPAPSNGNSANSTAKLGVWALIALLLPFTAGCSGTSVAQNIVNWTPTLQSAVATVDSTATLLDPLDAPIFTAARVASTRPPTCWWPRPRRTWPIRRLLFSSTCKPPWWPSSSR
jgi:hypothetical protein